MFYWDPRPYLFIIPYVNIPILWYGVLFCIGFALGFPIFTSILRRFFFNDPKYMASDILNPDLLKGYGKTAEAIAKSLNGKIERGEAGNLPERVLKFVKNSHCLNPQKALSRLFFDGELKEAVLGIIKKSVLVTDRLVIYMLIAIVLGARLGHYVFYERPSDYFADPLEILRVWEGGLASHGAAIAILIALWIFSKRIRKIANGLSWVRLLDFIAVPTSLCGALIRVGNFFNQEILGSPSSLPWAVTFGHPADHSFPLPRHPVQIYEALFYLFVFILLWRLTYRVKVFLSEGRSIGLFLILVFGFRFAIEFLKVEQSRLFSLEPSLTMGQILSIPMVLLGAILLFRSLKHPAKSETQAR